MLFIVGNDKYAIIDEFGQVNCADAFRLVFFVFYAFFYAHLRSFTLIYVNFPFQESIGRADEFLVNPNYSFVGLTYVSLI